MGVGVLASASTGWSDLMTGVTNMIDLSGKMLDAILAHPVYAGLFAAGVISVAIGLVTKFKHA